jgi:hypothetical protein
MPRRRLVAILVPVTAVAISIVLARVYFHDELLFAWDDFSCPVPQDFVDRRIGRLVRDRGCSPREASLFEDYCTRSGVGGLYAYAEMWSLFVRDPDMIRVVHAADSTGKTAHMILRNGPSCYLEYHGHMPDELSAKAAALYHDDLTGYLPNTAGLREEWDKLVTDPRLSTQPAQRRTQ